MVKNLSKFRVKGITVYNKMCGFNSYLLKKNVKLFLLFFSKSQEGRQGIDGKSIDLNDEV